MDFTRLSTCKARLAIPAALLLASLAVFACLQVTAKPAGAASGAASGLAASTTAVPAVAGMPVLVELFTSEGCSSCPPADALLAKLDATQFVPGAQAIVLSEHVTYWNYLGWRDPFSQEAFTARQQQYVERLGLESPYTPQVVVDGTTDVLGSDGAALARSVARAAAAPKPRLTIEQPIWQADGLHFAVHVAPQDSLAGLNGGRSPAHNVLMAALAEDATRSSVARGENAGRTLRHVAVVRVLKSMGLDAANGRPLLIERPAGAGSTMRLVVFLADSGNGKVQAAAEASLPR